MLKITQVEPINSAIVLQLEGRVVGPWVAELRRSCEAALRERSSLRLNLAGVEFMDAQGISLLASLRARGVSLLECPPFAAEQLKTAGRM